MPVEARRSPAHFILAPRPNLTNNFAGGGKYSDIE
jgi:hypothetical protein